jgi:peptidoglycan/LPS O-acetylase OafA/YrhL
VGLTSVLLVPVILTSRGFGQNEPAVQLAGQSLIAVWFAMLMMFTMSPEGRRQERLTRLFEAPWLRSLGKYSYAMYVVHFPLSQALLIPRITARLEPLSPAAQASITLGYGVLLLGVSYALAVVSWHLLEHPLTRVKERVAPRATRTS